jgi:hypothetical protein
MTETQISQELLEKCKKHFFKDKKVGFYKNWICVVNSLKHTNYKGSKNDIAYQKELDSIPPDVLDYFEDTLSIHYIYTRHTTINKKYKIINNKLEIENKKIDDDFLANIRKEIKDKLK